MRIAKILDGQEKPAEDSRVSTEYEVRFDDNTTIESDSPEVFSDEALTAPARPVAIRMAFHDYARGRHLSLAVNHGDATYGNVATISGSDPSWLSENFLALKDALDRARPQNLWVRRHQTLLVNLIALGIGSLVMLVIDALVLTFGRALGLSDIISPLPPDSPWLRVLISAQPFLYVAGWFWRWALGLFWGAFEVRRWLLAMWPAIEFDFGLPHFQTEKRKRSRLKAVGALVILPILTTLLYDLIKRAF
jgi:hypothetical protein